MISFTCTNDLVVEAFLRLTPKHSTLREIIPFYLANYSACLKKIKKYSRNFKNSQNIQECYYLWVFLIGYKIRSRHLSTVAFHKNRNVVVDFCFTKSGIR